MLHQPLRTRLNTTPPTPIRVWEGLKIRSMGSSPAQHRTKNPTPIPDNPVPSPRGFPVLQWRAKGFSSEKTPRFFAVGDQTSLLKTIGNGIGPGVSANLLLNFGVAKAQAYRKATIQLHPNPGLILDGAGPIFDSGMHTNSRGYRLPGGPVTLTTHQMDALARALSKFKHDMANELTVIHTAAELTAHAHPETVKRMDTIIQHSQRISNAVLKLTSEIERTLGISAL